MREDHTVQEKASILRCVLIFLIPIFVFCFVDTSLVPFIFALSLFAAVYEVAFSRNNKILFVVYVAQMWWVASAMVLSSADLNPNLLAETKQPPPAPAIKVEGDMKTMSVVLPCSGEGLFARKTVQSVYESVPTELLREIIVVDDNSSPPLETEFLDEEFKKNHKLRVLRQNSQQGLIRAKLIGGKAALGDIIVFFDCHVAPQRDWYKPFFEGMNENYKRVIIPSITNLDINSWKQVGGAGVAKCYITFDADFKWFDSDNDDVPALSGGLVGISNRWFNETGGFDPNMLGWGGENIDQSFRIWLCGGEMKMASSAEVAHMWRGSDRKTRANYQVIGSSGKNRLRAAMAWMGPLAEKIRTEFPIGQSGDPGDLSNIWEVRDRLKCKPFAYYLYRFRNIYIEGGLVPEKIFALKAPNGGCLRYHAGAGTSGNGRGEVGLDADCTVTDRHRFHASNRMEKDHKFLSPRATAAENNAEVEIPLGGLKAWNTDQCIEGASGKIKTTVCAVDGNNAGQRWRLIKKKIISSYTNKCISVERGTLVETECRTATEWEMHDPIVPKEWTYYQDALKEHPEYYV